MIPILLLYFSLYDIDIVLFQTLIQRIPQRAPIGDGLKFPAPESLFVNQEICMAEYVIHEILVLMFKTPFYIRYDMP